MVWEANTVIGEIGGSPQVVYRVDLFGSAAEMVADFPGLSGSRQHSFFVPTLKQTLVTFYF